MAISYTEVFKKFSPERQQRIKEEARHLVKQYESLLALRKELGLTQDDVAEAMGTTQVNISKLENRQDVKLSTLKKYVEALGYDMEINLVPKEV